jgi:hypothetical protein
MGIGLSGGLRSVRPLTGQHYIRYSEFRAPQFRAPQFGWGSEVLHCPIETA